MITNRRLVVRFLADASVSSLACPTWAQEPALKMVYPSKPIRFIIGFAPGAVMDTVTRQIADGLSTEFHQPVIVENRMSAGGIVALEALKSSAPRRLRPEHGPDAGDECEPEHVQAVAI